MQMFNQKSFLSFRQNGRKGLEIRILRHGQHSHVQNLASGGTDMLTLQGRSIATDKISGDLEHDAMIQSMIIPDHDKFPKSIYVDNKPTILLSQAHKWRR